MYPSKNVLHIGLHKTGTSAFQKVLQKNKNIFHENGVSCPSIRDVHDKLTYPHVYKNKGGFDKSTFYGSKGCLISDEDIIGKYYYVPNGNFYPNAKKYLSKLSSLMEWNTFDVWICFRNYSEWLESCYLQRLKHKVKFMSFEDYCDSIDFEKLSWVSLLSSISGLDFVSNVNVVFYEDFKKNNNIIFKMVDDTFDISNIDVRGEGGKVNPSISDIGYDVIKNSSNLELEDYHKLNRLLLKNFSSHEYSKPKVMSRVERELLTDKYNFDVNKIKLMAKSNDKVLVYE